MWLLCSYCGKKKSETFTGQVLDSESMKNPFYVSHKIKIGKTESEQDISEVRTVAKNEKSFISNKTVDAVLSEAGDESSNKKSIRSLPENY